MPKALLRLPVQMSLLCCASCCWLCNVAALVCFAAWALCLGRQYTYMTILSCCVSCTCASHWFRPSNAAAQQHVPAHGALQVELAVLCWSRGVFGRHFRQLMFWVQVFPGAPLSAHVDRSSKAIKEAAAQGNITQVRPPFRCVFPGLKIVAGCIINSYIGHATIYTAWLV